MYYLILLGLYYKVGNIINSIEINQNDECNILNAGVNLYQHIMIARLLIKIPHIAIRSLSTHNANSFVLLKMLKKRMKQKSENYQPKPQTYTAKPESATKAKQQQQPEDVYEHEYDFFSRQKEIELNKDYRKIRQQSQFIPQDVGKGGFDQVVYWSQFAKTPQQVLDLVKVFNRIKIPDEIGDKLRFQQFGSQVMNTVYLSSEFSSLQQYATFGQKYSIHEDIYWQKIEEKVVRLIPKSSQQIKDCIEIAFIMSKMGKGQTIYSSLVNIFKQIQINPQDTAKLLLVYANTETGQKQWIEQLTTNLINNLELINKEVLIQALAVFKKAKNLPDIQEKKIFQQLGKNINNFTFKQLCMVGGFVNHGKQPQQFWTKIEERALSQMPKKHTLQTTIQILQLISSYSISTEFVRNNLLPLLRQNKNKILYQLPPELLSAISKILYIYELENESKDIEQIIQTNIMKIFNTLKNVEIDRLIRVLKDYTITRIGSREFYIFLEQVIDALLPEIKKNREHLETICALYENSELCTAEFLSKLQSLL